MDQIGTLSAYKVFVKWLQTLSFQIFVPNLLLTLFSTNDGCSTILNAIFAFIDIIFKKKQIFMKFTVNSLRNGDEKV